MESYFSLQDSFYRVKKQDKSNFIEKYEGTYLGNGIIATSLKVDNKFIPHQFKSKIWGTNTEDYIYMKVPWKLKEYVKKIGGMWDNNVKLWIFTEGYPFKAAKFMFEEFEQKMDDKLSYAAFNFWRKCNTPD